MSRFTFASHPFLLGFEDLDRLLERTASASSNGFPPYNIEARGEDAWRIVLAVAGFAADDLELTLDGHELRVHGRPGKGPGTREFLHRGIAAREFRRSFVLDPSVEVARADLERGLLTIDLVRRRPEREVRTIRIGKPGDEGEA